MFTVTCVLFLIAGWQLTAIVVNLNREVVMSSASVRLDQDLIDAARKAAKAEHRTVQGQVEFWALVGRAALDNPDLPASPTHQWTDHVFHVGVCTEQDRRCLSRMMLRYKKQEISFFALRRHFLGP